MGFEYKIKAKFTAIQTAEIQYLLENSKMFDKKYEFDKQIFWDFRHPANTGKMPNISIVFEKDGIYICQHISTEVWTDLDILNYIQNQQIEYEILDYQA